MPTQHNIQHEIEILISLLDDPDDKVYTAARDKLFLHGAAILPHLEKAWETVGDEVARARIENIMQGVQKECLFAEMITWVATGGSDLLQGALLLSRFHYAGLDEFDAVQLAGRLTQDLWLEMNTQHTPLEKIKVLNHVFFEVHGFTSSLNPSPTIGELLIHEVLQKKKGSPVALGIIYLLMAQSMHLPLAAVNIAGHFAAAWLSKPLQFSATSYTSQSVDFYVNAPIKGAVFTKSDIHTFLDKHGITSIPSFYAPISNVAAIKVLADRVMKSYEREEDTTRIEQFKIFITAFD